MESNLPASSKAIALGCTLFLFSCARSTSPAPASAPSPKPQTAVASTPSPSPAVERQTPEEVTEDQVLLSVSKALRARKLLSRPDQCYAYQFDPPSSDSVYTVGVSENHLHTECGGDPQAQPHLFTVHINKSTHALSTDAQSPGIFHPLQP